MKLSLSLLINLFVVVVQSESPVEDGSDRTEQENVSKGGGKAWALLVAGTNGWSYYRHQANVCHAYKTLVENYKMPRDRIITMMYDDVANDPKNPHPGVLMNEPNGTNVYSGVSKDYTGEDVNVDNFYKILKGDKKGLPRSSTGRVIEPNSQNRIFIFFTGTGKGGFARLISDNIWADSFSKQLIDLKKNKKMKEALVYWESSHAGSMFETYLPYNSGVLAMTSAATNEDSFGWYCNIDDLPVCLAGHFSITWITDAKKKSAPKQTIFEHYNGVRLGVTSSHPNLYGSFKLGLKKLSYFFGGNSKMVEDAQALELSNEIMDAEYYGEFSQQSEQRSEAGIMAEKDIPVAILENEIKNAKSPGEKVQKEIELASLKKSRNLMEETMDSILEYALKGRVTDSYHDSSFAEHRHCFKKLAIQFQNICFNNNNYYVDYILPKLFAICKADAEAEGLKAMSNICTEEHRSLNHIV